MIAADEEAEFIDRIYEAAIEPALWQPLLIRFSDMLSGADANILFQDQTTGEGTALRGRGDPAALALYFDHFGSRNPLLEITDRPLGLRVLTDENKIEKRNLIRTEYYNDFMRRFELHSVLILRLAMEETQTACINITRSERYDTFAASEIEIAERLHPHFVRAFKLTKKLSARYGECIDQYFDESVHATFVVDAASQLRRANRAGEALLSRNVGLSIQRGVLRTCKPDETRRLHGLIAAAGSSDRRTAGDMMLTRAGHRLPLSITVAPARNERAALFRSAPLVLVCVSDPEAKVAASEHRLRNLLGLTQAEVRVALQLLDGRDPRGAAEQLGLSFYTVRGHLVRMFEKTGTRRQAELVRLMMGAVTHLNLQDH